MLAKKSLLQRVGTSVGAVLSLLILVVLLKVSFFSSPQIDTPGPTLPPWTEPPAPSPEGQAAEFSDTLLAQVPDPTSLAFLPDGRMLVTSQGGRLYVVQDALVGETPLLDLAWLTCSDSERGLMTVSVDPAFSQNHAIYLYYTYAKFGRCFSDAPALLPVQRVSRFNLNAEDVLKSEQVLIDNIPSLQGVHNGGGMEFGPDGLLYIGTGEAGCSVGLMICGVENDNARRLDVLAGKLLRVRPDGAIPLDNPWANEPAGRRCGGAQPEPGPGPCKEIYALGLRNPFRLAMDPNAATTRFFINDVGGAYWEEINLGQPGADYGWNRYEGSCLPETNECDPPAVAQTAPLYSYAHDGACRIITGGAFVPRGLWPAEYDRGYLFGDYACGRISLLSSNPDGSVSARPLLSDLGPGSVVDLAFGPHNGTQALYYISHAGDASAGEIHRVSYVGGRNRAPNAVLQVQQAYGLAPISAEFDASMSSDPDAGSQLLYRWDFGDGSPVEETTEPHNAHTYLEVGRYSVTLSVRDPQGAVATSEALPVFVGNMPPAVSLDAPGADSSFSAGETLLLRGHAGDAEDGPLSGDLLSWQVLLHVGQQVYPYLPPTSGESVELRAPELAELSAMPVSSLELVLTASDRQGLSTTVRQRIYPRLVSVALETEPSGLRLRVNDQELVTPAIIPVWEAAPLTIEAPDQLDGSSQVLLFRGWQDGEERRRTIPAADASYQAIFERDPDNRGKILQEYWLGLSTEGGGLDELKARFDTLQEPVTSSYLGSFEAPSDWGDGYGQRVRGYLYPPITGEYSFWIAADNQAELWLSSDADPEHRQLIASVPEFAGQRQWNDFVEQRSAPISLVAGRRYYIEALHKEESGGDNLSVSWLPPGGVQQIISGLYLSAPGSGQSGH